MKNEHDLYILVECQNPKYMNNCDNILDQMVKSSALTIEFHHIYRFTATVQSAKLCNNFSLSLNVSKTSTIRYSLINVHVLNWGKTILSTKYFMMDDQTNRTNQFVRPNSFSTWRQIACLAIHWNLMCSHCFTVVGSQ